MALFEVGTLDTRIREKALYSGALGISCLKQPILVKWNLRILLWFKAQFAFINLSLSTYSYIIWVTLITHHFWQFSAPLWSSSTEDMESTAWACHAENEATTFQNWPKTDIPTRSLLPHFSVLKNLEFFAKISGPARWWIAVSWGPWVLVAFHVYLSIVTVRYCEAKAHGNRLPSGGEAFQTSLDEI